MERPIVYIDDEVCRRYGAICLYPSDEKIKPADTLAGFAANIYEANIAMLEQCDVVITKVDPFRGPSMDVGAAFEIGFARALGKPVLGFSSYELKPYFQRLVEHYGELVPDKFGHRSKKGGLLLENFGLSDNLMLSHAIGKTVHLGFESALIAAVQMFTGGERQLNNDAIAHYRTAEEFPVWLNAFDNANDQHDVTLRKLESFLEGVRRDLPDSWRAAESLNVLDLACGDGRFSRRLVDLIESKLRLRVNYAAVELNNDFVKATQCLFPGGTIVQGNIFEKDNFWFGQIGQKFKPHLILLSHAIYFAQDKSAYVNMLAELAAADTVTVYLLNDPIYRPVQPDIVSLTDALRQTGLFYRSSAPFRSYVYFPSMAQDHIAKFTLNPNVANLDAQQGKTKCLLSFFQQSPLDALEETFRVQYLTKVKEDLLNCGGKVPVQNHCVVALAQDASAAMQQLVLTAINMMDFAPESPLATAS